MILFLYLTIILFILGSAIGSFINVLISRTRTSQQWVKGRSHCDHCNKPLKWYDMVPLLSYIWLRGQSRCCHQPISISHPVVEFLTGTMLVWWFWGGSLFFQLTKAPFQIIQPLFWLSVGIILLVIFLVDFYTMIIPDLAVWSLLLLTLLYRLALTITGVMAQTDFIWTILAAVGVWFAFFLLWFLTKGKGLGFGDVKLSIPMTLLLGWPQILVGLFLSFTIGGAVGAVLLLTGKKKLKQVVPFGPFLVVGTVITLVFGDLILRWYLSLL